MVLDEVAQGDKVAASARRGLSTSGIRNARDLHAARAYSETGIMKNEFLEETWRVREKLAARFDYDLHRMVLHLQKAQTKHGARLVRAPGPAVAGRRSRRTRAASGRRV